MKLELIDTNILTRFFIADIKNQHSQAEKIFKAAQMGKRKLRLEVLVVAEVCYVLESFYKRDRKEIADFLELFVSQKWLQVQDRKIVQTAWSWYLKGFHFVDSYLLAWVKVKKAKVLSFDKKLMKIGG